MSESARRYEADKTEWDRIAETREFKDLIATKKTSSFPPLYSPCLLLSAPGPCRIPPNFMATKVIGEVNLAYLFALSQFFMAWIIPGCTSELQITSTTSRGTSSRLPRIMSHGQEAGTVSPTGDVSDLHPHHSRNHYWHRNARPAAAPTLPPAAASPAGRTVSRLPEIT